MSLLEVKDLSVSFPTPDGVLRAVRGVTFDVEDGRTLGIVGESGSGKSVTCQTVMGLTQGGRVSGQALFEGRDLLAMTKDELRHVRGVRIAMIFQDPLSSLHPFYKVGWQLAEMIRAHTDATRRQARHRAADLLRVVGIPQAEKRVDDYPHQFSGGMRQRAMIAMAMSLNPKLLIADEPTTALDVTVQAQVLTLMRRLQEEFGTALIFITHDLGVVADIADDVMVMYAGRAVEYADRRTTYYSLHHPYTRGLVQSVPGTAQAKERLVPIPGQPPSLIRIPPGCPFHPRCPFVMDRCISEVPPLHPVAGGAMHTSACWLPAEVVGLGADVDERRLAAAEQDRRGPARQLAERLEASPDVAGPGAARGEGSGSRRGAT
ncbi:MAG: ABC transporter ATP-binding protein [Streptosporangiaceae bacterium]